MWKCTTRQVTAAKEHRCWACKVPIAKGERHTIIEPTKSKTPSAVRDSYRRGHSACTPRGMWMNCNDGNVSDVNHPLSKRPEIEFTNLGESIG